MSQYFRPIIHNDPARADLALPVAGTRLWFDTVERMRRGEPSALIPASSAPPQILEKITGPRPFCARFAPGGPSLMGVMNVTPDSFSDGGKLGARQDAETRARQMIDAQVEIIDVGGESTRPGAETVPPEIEIARTAQVIAAIRAMDPEIEISIDTRKAVVAEAAVEAGATIINDVSALTFDPAMAETVARLGVPICLMHAQGDPATMQKNPLYGEVVLDVYDHLSARIDAAQAAGISRDQIIIDPGIGFGKTLQHNLSLIRRVGLLHGLGCPVLLGVSRKRFIGTISGEMTPALRAPGSVAVALEGARQGVQIIRAHDIDAHKQAFALWSGLSAHR